MLQTFCLRVMPFVVVSFLATKGSAQNQVDARPLRLEVASIRLHAFRGDEPSNRQFLPGGRFVATATTVRTLIRIALKTDDDLISGVPGWIDRDLFDINAITADHAEPTTPEQLQQMILALLQERFAFRFHREQKTGPVYRLELSKAGKLGRGLKRSAEGSKPNLSTNSSGARTEMKATSMTMADVAAALTRQAGRPVEDHTDLDGHFDFQIEWSPQQTEDSTMPSLFTALQQELGLQLRSAKGFVEMVMIDHIEPPVDN